MLTGFVKPQNQVARENPAAAKALTCTCAQSIRRATAAAVVVSDDFCSQPGVHVSSILSTGADGFEIPLESFQRIFQAGDAKSKPRKALPSSWLGAVALVSASAVGAAYQPQRVATNLICLPRLD